MVPPSPVRSPGAWCRVVGEMDSWLDSVLCGKEGRVKAPKGPSGQAATAASLWLLIIVIRRHFFHLRSISLAHGEGRFLPLAEFHLLKGLASEGSLCNPICTMGC